MQDNETTEDNDDDPIGPQDYGNVVWGLIDSYFAENRGLQSQAIASFNRFLRETLPKIVNKCGKVSVEHCHNNLYRTVHSIEMMNCYLEKEIIYRSPDGKMFPMYPHEARIRNSTYSTPLSVDIRHTIKSVDAAGFETVLKEEIHRNISIADIPIMVKSELCRLNGLSERAMAAVKEDPNDPGGYFIINGKEKVIVTQERPANNKLFLFKPMCDSKYQYECEIRSTIDSATDKVSALWIHIPGNPKSYSTFKDSKGISRINSGGNKNVKVGRSIHCQNVRKTISRQYLKNRPGLITTIATVRTPIPVLILFKALGFETDGEIWETFLVSSQDIDFHEALRTTMENVIARTVRSADEALSYIGHKSVKEEVSSEEAIYHGRKVINEQVLPALGNEEICNRLKGYHIGYMVNRLVFAYLGRIPCDDRDHLQNKRFDLAGPMLATLFKNQIKSLMGETRLSILRRLENGLDYDVEKNIIRQKLITRGIIYSMMSGNWGDKRRGSSVRVGVSQLLNRLTGMATVSYLRRVNCPFNRLVRMTAPRQVHTTAFGYICPADTPEGETVGLLKSLAVTAEISNNVDRAPIVECLEELGYNSIETSPEKLSTDVKILIDSEIMGTCPTERALVIIETLKQRRREFDEIEKTKKNLELLNNRQYRGNYRGFSNQVSIVYDREFKEIHIWTDAGRAFRPLLVVKNNELALRKSHVRRLLNPKDPYNWKNLIKDGVIEFLDAAESETAMIAMFPGDLDGSSGRNMTYISKFNAQPLTYKVTYTHCEIHPSMMLGVCASLIPFPDHNQSPRNSYQSGMAKQAIGVYQTNFNYRSDPEAHVLHYPQRPLVTTKTAKFINYDDNPAGINTISAIFCYSGYNQEDSIILNKSAVQRGLFRSTLYRLKSDEAKVYRGRGDMDETFELPRNGQVAVCRAADYTNLDIDGLPEAGIKIKDSDPVIGKTQCIGTEISKYNQSLGRKCPTKADVSLLFRNSATSAPSYVDSVILTNNQEGYRLVRVKIRTPRIPQIGDKFASRHGQKGVVGMDFEETDLPFTKDGTVPDLILNPHAIPSRMTIGHLIETVYSKLSALKGNISDGTCFTRRLSVDEIGAELEKYGFHKHGMEVVYNGATGRKILNQIFIGPVFNQRLKHMTEDKLHVRCRGPVTELCRQPCAGLQRDGGLRFGEMERDSTITHGGAAFLRERLFIISDYYNIPVCNGCGHFLVNKKKGSSKEFVLHLKCRFCNRSNVGATTVELPFACKLFFQELMSMNINVIIKTENTSRQIDRARKKIPAVSAFSCNIVSQLIRKMEAERMME